jgi:hypothetical protein
MPNIQFPSSYSFAKRFVSSSFTTVGGGNGVTAFDDPTYLGFTLVFDRTSPLFNGADKGETQPANSQLGSQQSPTQGGGQVNLNLPDSPPQGGQAKTIPGGESAVGYLEAIGEKTRATYLRSFIQGLLEINDTRPYYWQSISGLVEAWEKTFNFDDPYIGTKIGETGEGIQIDCLEAIDLKMSALFTLYKMAVYDNKYRRYILPKNLMYFDAYVYVQEIRKFNTLLDVTDREIKTGEFVNQNTSQICFKFGQCTWIPIVASKVFDGVKNSGGNEVAASSIKWGYSTIEMISQFSGYNSSLNESRKQTGSDISTGNPSLGSKLFPKSPVVTDAKFVDQLKQTLRDQFGVFEDNFNRLSTKENLGNTFSGELSRLRNVALQRISLGNIFGIRNQLLQNIQNPQLLQNAVNGAAFQIAETIRNRNRRGPSIGDNPLGDGIEPRNTISAGSIFPDLPDQTNLGSSNIFGSAPSGPPPLDSTNVFGQ